MAQPALKGTDLHVWRAGLALSAHRLKAMLPALSEARRSRPQRSPHPRDQARFLASHAILRAILSTYLGLHPEQLRFRCGAHGKPDLAWSPGCGPLQFSMSHAHLLALYAISRVRRVGAGVEYVPRPRQWDWLAARCLTPADARAVRSPEPVHQGRQSLCCLIKRKALIKDINKGLAVYPLDWTVQPHDTGEWTVRSFEAAADYIATVAAEGRGLRLKRLVWEGPPCTSGSEVG